MADSTQKQKRIWSDVTIYALMLIFVFLLYLCNHLIIFMQDDLWYWTNLVTGERISSVGDIVQSQVWHYQNWGGRTVAHTLLQFLLWGDGKLCNVLNTIAFDALAVFLAKAGRKWNAKSILLAGSMMVAFNPNMLDTLLWQSGTANYLYMTLLSFPLVWIYVRTLLKDEEKKTSVINSVLAVIGMLVWGLLAGWTNENMGPTYFLISVIVIVLTIRKKKKVSAWMIAGSLSLAAGSAMMILAPGNRVRGNEIESLGSWKLDLCKRVLEYLQGAFGYLLPVLIFATLSYVLYRLVMKKRPDMATLLILIAGVVSYLGLALSPHVPDRSLFGSMCFFIWGSVRMLGEVFAETKKERYHYLITLFIAFTALYKLFFFWAQGVGWYRY
jgi:hypothetical protein